MENKLFLTPTEIHELECMRPFPDFSATNLATASFYSKAQISKVLKADYVKLPPDSAIVTGMHHLAEIERE